MECSAPITGKPGPLTVLIADDEPHIRHIVSTKLKNAGFVVIIATNGRDALDMAREHHPALIVTDFQMPVLSGYEMSLQLKQDDRTAGIPIILLTARGHKLTQSELDAAGIKLLMDKPFSPSDLMSRVKGVLQNAA